MLLQSDGFSAAVNVTKWMFSVTSREASDIEFLVVSGVATPVCQQSLSDSLGGKPSGAGVQDNDPPRWVAQRSSCAHVTESGDFRIAPRTLGMLEAVISVGQVADRGNVIVFRSSVGTIFNERTGGQREFQGSRGLCRLKAATSAKLTPATRGANMLMRLERTCGCTACYTWNCGRGAKRVGSRGTRVNTPTFSAGPGGVSKFATDCMFMGEDGTPITILAGYDGMIKAFFATVVLCTGMDVQIEHLHSKQCPRTIPQTLF